MHSKLANAQLIVLCSIVKTASVSSNAGANAIACFLGCAAAGACE